MKIVKTNIKDKKIYEGETVANPIVRPKIEPVIKPETEPNVKPKYPRPIRRDKPSIIPKPKASLEDVTKRYISLISNTNESLLENVQQAKSILKAHNLDTSDNRYTELLNMLRKNIGLIGIFTKWAIEDNEDISELKQAYITYMSAKKQNLNLKSIDSFENLEQFNDYLHDMLKEQTYSKLYKNVPKKVKKLINNDIQNLIELNSKYLRQIENFLRKKGNVYNTSKELYDALIEILKSIGEEWDIDSYINYFKQYDSNKLEVVYSNNDILVIDLKDFYTGKQICSDGKAATSWCIIREKSSWDNYITSGFAKQYFIYDFRIPSSNPLSRIATTITSNGRIKDAMDFNDNPVKNPKEYFEKELGI